MNIFDIFENIFPTTEIISLCYIYIIYEKNAQLIFLYPYFGLSVFRLSEPFVSNICRNSPGNVRHRVIPLLLGDTSFVSAKWVKILLPIDFISILHRFNCIVKEIIFLISNSIINSKTVQIRNCGIICTFFIFCYIIIYLLWATSVILCAT